MECLFCKIINHEAPANIIFSDKDIVAFDDLYPKAPQHKLIVPRKHIATINDLEEDDIGLVGQLINVAKQLAKKLAIDETGYRVLMNCNRDGRQVIFHIHLHLLGGRLLNW